MHSPFPGGLPSIFVGSDVQTVSQRGHHSPSSSSCYNKATTDYTLD